MLSGQLYESADQFEAVLEIDPNHDDAIQALAANYRLSADKRDAPPDCASTGVLYRVARIGRLAGLAE
jgi:hypothetical protein